MSKLLIFLPDGTQAAVELTADELSIGRLPENDIVISDESLSGRHARILVRDGVVVLEDLGSTNGTFVNGSQIQEAALVYGDQLQFGAIVAEFQSGEEEVAAGLVVEEPLAETDVSLESSAYDQEPDHALEDSVDEAAVPSEQDVEVSPEPAEEPADELPVESAPAFPVGQSRRPPNFTSISPIKRERSNNDSNVPLIAAGVVGFLAVGVVIYTLLGIASPT